MTMKEHFIYRVMVGGGCGRNEAAIRAREQRADYAINVDVEFDGSVPEHVRMVPRVAGQLEFITESIRRHMQTPEFRSGKIAASLGQPIDGAEFEIGDPPTFNRLEESYGELTFGRIEPEKGYVCLRTFEQIVWNFNPNVVDMVAAYPDGLRFNGARIYIGDSVPIGYVRWFYGSLV